MTAGYVAACLIPLAGLGLLGACSGDPSTPPGSTQSGSSSSSTAGGGGASSGDGGSNGASGGTGTGGDSGHLDVPRGPSKACGTAAPGEDSSEDFIKHDIEVTGVDPEFIAAHPPQPSLAPYTWTHRNYFVRLPANYDPSKAYPVSMGGGGCGGDALSGNNGGLTALPKGQDVAIQIGLSYVYSGGACFEDKYVNTPDLPYFDAVLADVASHYCIDTGKVFVDGFSSGAWETFMLGCARAGVVRGIGTAAGGLRVVRPACSELPVAAMMVAGIHDTTNPIGPLTMPVDDGYGSAAARDDILKRNGCVGSDNTPWDKDYPDCVKYSGCPTAYPVVWCAIDDGHTSGHPQGGPDYSGQGFWKFWSALPPAP